MHCLGWVAVSSGWLRRYVSRAAQQLSGRSAEPSTPDDDHC